MDLVPSLVRLPSPWTFPNLVDIRKLPVEELRAPVRTASQRKHGFFQGGGSPNPSDEGRDTTEIYLLDVAWPLLGSDVLSIENIAQRNMFCFKEVRDTAEAEGVFIDGWSLKKAFWPVKRRDTRDDAEHVNVIEDWSHEEEKKLVRKLDFRVLLPCCLVYFIAYLDRANMGYADTLRAGTRYNLSEVLGLHGSDFSWAVSITYFAVTVLLVPSNLLMKRVSGKYFFPVAMLLLGTIVSSIAAVKSYAGLLAARFFLGVPEAAIPSACIMYFTFWYKPSERALRVGIFEASNAFATAVGGFISIGIDTLNDKAGMESWRWLFLIEGLMAIAVVVPIAWLLLTYPETTSALNERERHIAINRLGRGGTRSTDATWDISSLSQLMIRPSTYVFFVSYLCVQIVAASFSTFLPIILKNFAQFSPHKATAYTSIVYFVIIPCYWVWAWHSDHTRERVWHIIIPLVASLPCFAVWTYVASNKSYGNISPITLYGMAFIGHNLNLWNPPMLSYRSATLYGASEQALGGAITLAAISIASIIGPQIYSESQKPWYFQGFTTSCVVLSVAIVGYASLPFWLAMEANQRKKATGHAMPSRALEDALHAQVSDQVIANEILQVEGEAKDVDKALHHENA